MNIISEFIIGYIVDYGVQVFFIILYSIPLFILLRKYTEKNFRKNKEKFHKLKEILRKYTIFYGFVLFFIGGIHFLIEGIDLFVIAMICGTFFMVQISVLYTIIESFYELNLKIEEK